MLPKSMEENIYTLQNCLSSFLLLQKIVLLPAGTRGKLILLIAPHYPKGKGFFLKILSADYSIGEMAPGH